MKSILLLTLVPFAFASALHAADAPAAKPPIATYLSEADARKAGPDFDLQGEYADSKLGAQVIALGNDMFRIVFHKGGLPGAGWDKSAKTEIEAKRDGDKVEFAKDAWKATLTRNRLSGETDSGKFSLAKVNRQSPTLGVKPPPGAIVLFDGSNHDAWTEGHFDDQGRKLLAAGTKTKRTDFQDFMLHVEFLLPFKPLGRGQDRGNSGIYIQERYEIQVLDSFGLEGKNNECGAIYTRVKPAVNMCFPPLVWQTYEIDFQAARFDAEGKKIKNAVVTVRHNGTVVQDKVEIEGKTGAGKTETSSLGPILLQGHGNPVFYRNIWIVTK
jgi:hypothetical protein